VIPVLFSELPGNDPIFIEINRLAAKGLNKDEQDPIQYLCQVVNRFRCRYDKTNNKENDSRVHAYKKGKTVEQCKEEAGVY
jgi:hypothetical protein